jgi:hypothetical protein
MSLNKPLWSGKIKLFPAKESFYLVSDIPAGDGKMANLFLQCTPSLELAVGKENIREILVVFVLFILRVAAFVETLLDYILHRVPVYRTPLFSHINRFTNPPYTPPS